MGDSQLQTLFDYTKFHIGLYSTLVSGIFGVIAFGEAHSQILSAFIPYLCLLKITSVLILIAGAAAGAIASNIPEYRDFQSFATARLKIFFWPVGDYYVLAHIEHIAFWLAIASAAYVFLRVNVA